MLISVLRLGKFYCDSSSDPDDPLHAGDDGPGCELPPELRGNKAYASAFWGHLDPEFVEPFEDLEARGDLLHSEYRYIGLLFGHLIDVIKISTGDFGVIDRSVEAELLENNWLFWLVWLISTFIACIIFLNFIIAEASASYEAVNGRIEETIAKAKASMIYEAEMMKPLILKND